MSPSLDSELCRLKDVFEVSTERLQAITSRFVEELEKGLTIEGGDIPMNPTWCMAKPTGEEMGEYLAIDMGGTNLRVCRVTLLPAHGEYDVVQTHYKIPGDLKTASSKELWTFTADCLQRFLEEQGHSPSEEALPLAFTFSYPVTQDRIDHGILQRWTKGFDIEGVEGEDVVAQFREELDRRAIPVKIVALVNDTVGTLIASAYREPDVSIGAIFGTGCNAAYMERCGAIPKLAHLNLDPDLPMTVNCEWGAFDNVHAVLPRTTYDIKIDVTSPRPGQQSFEKMIAGLYLGELFRLMLLELHDASLIFAGQDVTELRKVYNIDSSLLCAIEADTSTDLSVVQTLLRQLGLEASLVERRFCQGLSEIICQRAARLTACGLAAICRKQGWHGCEVGADGSLFHMYPQFRARQAEALMEILGSDQGAAIKVVPAEDGSGVGAAIIAALTLRTSDL